MFGFIEELKAVLGVGSLKRKPSHDQKADASPAKRAKQDTAVPKPLMRPEISEGQLIPGVPAPKVIQPAATAQQQLQTQQQQVQVQQSVLPMQQPNRPKTDWSGFNEKSKASANAFKQLDDSQRRSGTALALAGVAQTKAARYFAGGVPAMQPRVGSNSTPVIGWASTTTPHAAPRSQPRLRGFANSSRFPMQQQRQQATVAAALGSAAQFGPVAPATNPLTPDQIKQRLSFEAPTTAARATAAAAAGRPANNRAAGASRTGFFSQMLSQAGPSVGFNVVGASGRNSRLAGEQPLAAQNISPGGLAAVGVGTAAAVAAYSSPAITGSSMLFAAVPALHAPETDKIEQEIAEQRQRVQKLRQRDQRYSSKIEQLQASTRKALALSPGYQANPATQHVLDQLLQQGEQKQQQRLQHEAELLHQRNVRSPAGVPASPAATAAAAARLGRDKSAAAAAAVPAVPQQPTATDESDDVICLSSDDEEAEGNDDEQQQYEDEYEERSEGSDEYASEVGSAQEEDEAAAGVEALHLERDRWIGRRSNWAPADQQMARYTDATQGPGPRSEVLTSHERACIELSREHLMCLRSGEWLNDEVMNMYMALLQDRDTALRSMSGARAPRCHFFNTFFLNKLYKDAEKYNYANVRRWSLPKRLEAAGQKSECLLDLDRIIVPVHEGVHWTAAMVDLVGKRFVFFDSLLGRNPWAIKSLRQWLHDEAKDKRKEDWDTASWPELYPQDIPRQRNGCDCGVFALLFCDRLGLGQPFDFQQDDLLVNARVRVCCELLDGQLPLPTKHQN